MVVKRIVPRPEAVRLCELRSEKRAHLNMSLCLKMLNTSAQWSVLRHGSRVFGLLGKATPFGLSSFTRQDIPRAHALADEMGQANLVAAIRLSSTS